MSWLEREKHTDRKESASMVIQMRYRANMGLIYGRLRHTGVVLVIMLALYSAIMAAQ